jgi:hypothetical protein
VRSKGRKEGMEKKSTGKKITSYEKGRTKKTPILLPFTMLVRSFIKEKKKK